MRPLFHILFFLGITLLFGQLLYKQRSGFSPRKISYLKELCPTDITKEERDILSQKFTFLARGRQSFAFESEDGKYVLKFPRTDHLNLSFLARTIPFLYPKEKLHQKKEKERVLGSYEIAKHRLKDLTGLISIHFGVSNDNATKVTLIDPLGFPLKLNLNQSSFILQKKIPLWAPQFLQAKKDNNTEKQTHLLNALLNCLCERARCGVFNKDPHFLKNYAYENGKAYQIDLGDFFTISDLNAEQIFQKSAKDAIAPIRQWLENTDPTMVAIVDQKIQEL